MANPLSTKKLQTNGWILYQTDKKRNTGGTRVVMASHHNNETIMCALNISNDMIKSIGKSMTRLSGYAP
jgi:hypothetical protein